MIGKVGVIFLIVDHDQAVSFEEASKFAIKNNIKSGTDWDNFIKKNILPYNIPKSPDAFYGRRGTWTSWGDFLQTGNKSKIQYDYRYNFEQLKKICKKKNITNMREYRIFRKKILKLDCLINHKYFKILTSSVYLKKCSKIDELKKIAQEK